MTLAVEHRPVVIAHRGLHVAGRPTQNSLAAFAAAFDVGADAVELDVRRTRDGVLVIHHDPYTTAGQRISDVDYADLAALPDGQRIPTLVESLELVRRRGRRVFVELKEQGYEWLVASTVRQLLPLEQFRIMSFEPASIDRIERFMPEISTGVIVPHIPDWLRDALAGRRGHLGLAQSAAMDAAWAGADFIMQFHMLASDDAIADARARGLDVFITTLDTPRLLDKYLRDPRVLGVLTNRADIAVAARATAQRLRATDSVGGAAIDATRR